MVMTPDGKHLIIADNGYGNDNLVVVDTETAAVEQTIGTPDNWLFY